MYQEQRVETVNELRRLLREAQWRMVDAAAPSEFDDPGDPPRAELIEHAGERVDELDGYHRDRAPWLVRKYKRGSVAWPTSIRISSANYESAFAHTTMRMRPLGRCTTGWKERGMRCCGS